MRTTLNIDDDVLLAARAIARRDEKTVGQVISEWCQVAIDKQFYDVGLRTQPHRACAEPVTNDVINRMREPDGI